MKCSSHLIWCFLELLTSLCMNRSWLYKQRAYFAGLCPAFFLIFFFQNCLQFAKSDEPPPPLCEGALSLSFGFNAMALALLAFCPRKKEEKVMKPIYVLQQVNSWIHPTMSNFWCFLKLLEKNLAISSTKSKELDRYSQFQLQK